MEKQESLVQMREQSINNQDETIIITQEDAYLIEQRGSPKKKRILIKSSVSTNNAVIKKEAPPAPRQPSSGRRRPPTASQRLESARSNRRPPKSGGRIGPSTNTMKMQEPPIIETRALIRDETDNIFDQIFDHLTSSLASENSPKIEEGVYMQQFAEKLRREALSRYELEEAEVLQRYEDTKHSLQQNKDYLLQKQEQLLNSTALHETKAEYLIDSMSAASSKDFPCAAVCDQGWKLLQNWVFSLITDQEKCIRYSKLKLSKQIEHVSKEKQRYQESRVNNVLQQIMQNVKQIPIAKVQMVKNLKPLKEEVVNMLQEGGLNAVEHIGTIRSKPYLKLQAYNLHYRVSKESYTYMPCFSTLLRDTRSITDSISGLLHLSPSKLKINQEHLNEIMASPQLMSSLITNEVIQLFQEPDLTSKREPRVFICSKEAQENKRTTDKQDIRPFTEFMTNPWTLPVTENLSIKRLKNTNQLKLQQGTSQQAVILSECKLQHLFRSRISSHYFDLAEHPSPDSLIESFYIIEENSMFASSGDKIVQNQRKIKHFRKLTDFEVVLLIIKSIGHAVQGLGNQAIEVKIGQEYVKKMAMMMNKEDGTSDISFQSVIQGIQGETSRYLIVDCLTDHGLLVKQYMIKQTIQMSKQKAEPTLCLYPNCLQCVQPNQHHELYSQKSQIVQHNQNQQQQQLVQIRKPRPESASAANRNLNSNRVTGVNIGPRRLCRLSALLDIDIAESPLIKVFGKRFKVPANQQQQQQQVLVKDKSTKSIVGAGGSSTASAVSTVNTIDPQKSITLQRRDSTSLGTLQANSNTYCLYHTELERFFTLKLSLYIVPITLRPNTLHKALKSNYQTWKDEIKPSLAFDLFQKNSNRSQISDYFEKILQICLKSLQSVKIVPDNSMNFVEVVFNQQPQMINVLENYYSWMTKANLLQKFIYFKNPAFREASDHFLTQIEAFNMNLKQAKDNEMFLTNELKKWVSQPHFVSTILQTQLFQLLQDIVRSKDVLFKFQQFQAFSERINSNSQMLMSLQDQAMLPKIAAGQGEKSVTHSQGFFPRQESFNSGKNMEKLTQIYGGGGNQQQIANSAGALGNLKKPNASMQGGFTQQMAEHLRQTAAMYDMVSTQTSKTQPQLTQVIRKQSAGNKRDQNNDGVGHSIQNSTHYFSYQSQGNNHNNFYGGSYSQNHSSQGDRNHAVDSPQSNKAYKPLTKTDILLPLPIPTTITSGVVVQKQRASSAHKNNLEKQNQLLAMTGTINSQDQYGIRAATNTSIYEMNSGAPFSHSQMRNSKQQYTEIQAQAMAVASTFQQPPPKVLPNSNILQIMSSGGNQSLNPLQQIYGGRMARPMNAPPNLIGSQQQQQSQLNKPLALKHLERQQIIVNTYSQPTQLPQKMNPNLTSQGFNPIYQQPQRVASANQQTTQQDREKKKMIAFEKQAHLKKSKKKQVSHSNASGSRTHHDHGMQEVSDSYSKSHQIGKHQLEDYYMLQQSDHQVHLSRPYTQGQ